MAATTLASAVRLVDAFFRVMSLPWVPWVLSALIVGTALAVWRDFRVGRIGPVLRGLDDAIAAVEEVEGPGAFRRRFPALFKRLADNPVVGEAWRGYAPTIATAPGSDDALGYTRRPQESFGEELLALAGVNLRFFHAVPNLLVGAGLLFTFLGLVAALYFASRGVAAAEVAEAQRALRELLAAATFKFVTSIAGLGSSLVFSWREKALLHRVQRRLAHFCGALEARMVPLTAESIGLAQLAELRQQQHELHRLGRSLLVRVPETVEERMAAELAAAFAPLREATAVAASRLARVDEWVLQLVLDAAAPAGGGDAGAPHPAGHALPILERLEAFATAVRELRPDAPALPTVAAVEARAAPADLAETLRTAPEVARGIDARLGEALLRVRDLAGKLAGGRRPGRADIESATRLLLEAQGSLQQAKAASGRLAERLDALAREAAAESPAAGAAADGPEGAEAFRRALEETGQELRQTLRLLETGALAATERLALAAGRLGGAG